MSTPPECMLCEKKHWLADGCKFVGTVPVRTVKQPVKREARPVGTEVTKGVVPVVRSTVAGEHGPPEGSAPEIAVASGAERKKPQVHECPECRARHVRKLGMTAAEYMKEYRKR